MVPVRRSRRPGAEAGMVTAETAVVLPVLLFVLAGAIAAVVVVAGQLRCVDAAREGARAAARGEPAAVVQRIAGAAGPDGAVVGVGRSGDTVTTTVAAVITPLGPVPWRVTVTATATAEVEPAARGSAP
ncbi:MULTISPECIES: TadE family type IV pilus minor pilin [unclassified Modestobacter]